MSEKPNDTLEPDLSKSKSQIKREMIELQEIGQRLVTLNNQQLLKIGLPSDLYKAIQEAKKINSHSAKRRQFQYIGRLMREIEDLSPITNFLLQLDNKDQKAVALFHMLEALREHLVSGNAEVLTEFIENHPKVDRQYLRQLIANAKKERIQGKPAGAGKLLFQYLKGIEANKSKMP